MQVPVHLEIQGRSSEDVEVLFASVDVRPPGIQATSDLDSRKEKACDSLKHAGHLLSC